MCRSRFMETRDLSQEFLCASPSVSKQHKRVSATPEEKANKGL